MSFRGKTLAIFLLGLISSAALAQNSTFTGHVTDPSGAAVAKSTVRIHNEETGVNTTTTTGSSGTYTVPYLKPGTYSVTVEAQGFKREKKTAIVLQVSQTAVIDFALEVGGITETVTVKADGALLDYGKADHGEVVENTRVTELPLNGRDPGMLSILNAGAVWTGDISKQRPFDDTMQHLNINGGGEGNNALLLDGVSNETTGENGGKNSKIANVTPVDSVQEFKIITNTYDAQYGRASGGVVDMTLKSGTNKIHGDVYEFARRTFLDANTWQNNYIIAKARGTSNYEATKRQYNRPQHKLDQYGFELDGPVRIPKIYDGRDKAFFLTQFENWNERVPGTIITSVPDPAWVNGDFSNLTWYNGSHNAYEPIYIYDPLTLKQNAAGAWVRDKFPNNKIPASRLNPVAQKIMSYYPKPNLTPASGTNLFANNFSSPAPTTDVYRNALAKLDFNLSPLDRFSIRYGYWTRVERSNTNGMPGPIARGSLPYGERSHTFATEWTHTFNANFLFDFRGVVNVRNDFNTSGATGYDQTALGWPASMVGQFGYTKSVFPYIQPSEFAYVGSNAPKNTVGNSLSLFPTVTWIKGKFSTHAGIDVRLLQYAITSNEGGPYFWVDRKWTQSNYIGSNWTSDSGNSFATMLLGTMSSGNININSLAFWSQHYYAPFVQVDWKATRKLTLNLGIRYDLNMPQVERQNRANYAFDTAATNPVDSLINHSLIPGGKAVKGGVTFLGVNGKPRTLYDLVKNNIQPRVGFAYAATPRTVIRGGFGEMFQNPTPGGNQLGFSAQTDYVGSVDGDKTPINNLSLPWPTIKQQTGSSLGMLTSLGQGPWFLNPNFKIPSYWNYSVGIQQQIASHDTLEVSYVGSRSYNNNSSDNINPPSISYVSKCNIEMGGNPNTCYNDYPTNPFYKISGFEGSGYYSSPTIQGANLTRPFPAFGDITEWQLNQGRTWFNSLQVTGMHKWNSSLTMHGTWTWSKLMDAGGWVDTTYRVPIRKIDDQDRTHRITLSGVYLLPIGRGHKILGSTNRLVDAVIGGWELGGLYVYETGRPWKVPNNPNVRYTHNAWVPRKIESTGYIRGVAACASKWSQDSNGKWSLNPLTNYNYSGSCSQSSFVVNPDYGALTNTVYTGIRIPSNHQFDSNLSKNFGIYENMKLQLRIESFNTFNHPLWQQDYVGSVNDTDFGTIQRGPTGQSNLPRQTQIAIKILW